MPRTTARDLAARLLVLTSEVDRALLHLEAAGTVLRYVGRITAKGEATVGLAELDARHVFASIALTQAYYSGWFTTKSSPVGFMNTEAPKGESISFNHCHIGGGYNCVVDGDTINLQINAAVSSIDSTVSVESENGRVSTSPVSGSNSSSRLRNRMRLRSAPEAISRSRRFRFGFAAVDAIVRFCRCA